MAKEVHLLPGRLRLAVPNLKGNHQMAAIISSQLSQISGVTDVKASSITGRVLVYYNPARIDHNSIIICLDEIKNGIVSSGKLQTRSSTASLALFREAEDLPLGRQLLQVIFSGAVLLLLFFKHRIFGRSALSYSRQLFHLAAITTIVTGYPIFFNGVQYLTTRGRINYDLIIGVTTALLILRESFTGLLITWIINLSELLQTLNLVRANQAIREIVGIWPEDVWLLIDGTEVSVPVNRVMPGDIAVVHPGENIAVDGKVISGEASVDESRITGTPYPVYKESGAEVMAGAMVLDGELKIRVEHNGEDRYLYRMIEGVHRQPDYSLKSDINNDRRSDRLVSISLLLSLAVFILTRNVDRSLAMLLAACPSALGVAAPAAVGAAIGGAANRGIYIRDGRYLLAAGNVDTVVFDKTGTLTLPRAEIQEVMVINKNFTKEDIIALAALAEGLFGHPVAGAVRDKAGEMHIGPLPAAQQISLIPGQGVQAVVDNRQVLVGNERLMADRSIVVDKVRSKVARFHHLGLNPAFVAVDGKLCGLLAVKESLKPGSRQSIEQLRANGVSKIVLLTGDTQDAAQLTAGQLGIEESYGNALPDQKAGFVRNLKKQGYKVAVVGDGINDISAMAEADTGIALGCTGIESAACTGGMVIPSQDPRMVVEAVRLGQETKEVVKQNYSLAAGLNIVGLGLGAAGLISPLSAGLFTNIGTFVVIINSMGLAKKQFTGRRQKGNRSNTPPPAGRRTTQSSPGAAGVVDVISPARWHIMNTDEVLRYFNSDKINGLTIPERESRIAEYGPNRLHVEKKTSWFSLMLEPFRDFMVQLLLGASVISLVVGEYADALVIVAIVGVEAVLGVVQGLKAEKSLAALKKLAAPAAKVLIEGEVVDLKSEQLVPGDIVLLEEGDSIPADCRLIQAANLELEESSLTGESLPVSKTIEICLNQEIMLADRTNMVFMGTSITKGRGMAIVVATGMNTEMGRVVKLMQGSETEPTPLQLQMEQLGKQLSLGCLLVCGGVVATGMMRGRPLMEMLKTGVSLAVGAIPEGLPAVVTIAMAFGVQRMVKGHAIVRSLPAVETIGSATVICTDKTGTLTKNEMTVTEVYNDGKTWQVTGDGYLPEGEFKLDGQPVNSLEDKNLCRILTAAALCNNANISYIPGQEPLIFGDPTEVALLTAAIKGGVLWPEVKDRYCRQKEVSFDSTRKMMTVVCHDSEGTASVYTKGAVDTVLDKCSRVFVNNKVVELDLKTRNNIISANRRMASRALRVLAVAYKPWPGTGLPGDQTKLPDEKIELPDDQIEQDLIFIGMLGMVDPPRAGVYEAIQRCRQAGIKVVMVTGDHPITAATIAGNLGILQDGLVLSGRDIDKMSDGQLSSVIDQVEVCSRTTPEQKLRIVKAFKDRGHVVAMTGDGVNDAPALKEADVGVAMGRKGTDVAREAAGITLTDDNFATIVTAVEEGRTVGDNIRKSIRYVLAGNFGEVLAIFVAAVSGLPLPLVPSQILWVNLVTESIPAMAMGADPPEADVMSRPPIQSNEGILAGGLGSKIVAHSILTGLTTFGVFAGTLMLGGGLVKARTMAFANLVVSQLFNFFDCRKPNNVLPVEGKTGNKLMVPSAGASGALLLSAIYVPPMSALFQTVPLGIADWGILLLSTGLVGRIDHLLRADKTLPAPVGNVILLPEAVPAGQTKTGIREAGAIS